MAGENTTTTTTEDPSTTTTTTVDEGTDTTTTTTVMPLGEGTESDNSPVLGDHNQTEEDRLNDARHDALVNSQGEQDTV